MANKAVSYFKETREELARVSWPGRDNVIRHTLLVIAISGAVAIYLGAADLLFTYGLQRLITG